MWEWRHSLTLNKNKTNNHVWWGIKFILIPLGGLAAPQTPLLPWGGRRPPQTPRLGGKAPRTPLARKRAWHERQGNMQS